MCSQKTRAENYIFIINPTTTVATKTAAENAQELWEMFQTAMSQFVGTEILLILIFISIVIFFSRLLVPCEIQLHAPSNSY